MAIQQGIFAVDVQVRELSSHRGRSPYGRKGRDAKDMKMAKDAKFLKACSRIFVAFALFVRLVLASCFYRRSLFSIWNGTRRRPEGGTNWRGGIVPRMGE